MPEIYIIIVLIFIILSVIIKGIIKYIYNTQSVYKPPYHYTSAPCIDNDQYLSEKKYKLMNLIAKTHYEDANKKTPCKYEIPDNIRNHSRTLGIPLYWSQWKTCAGTRERIVIWKPLKFLKLECERTMNKYHMKQSNMKLN